MDLSCRFTGDVAVLDLAGPFVVSEDETEILALRSALAALVAEGCTLVALNLARLTFIDARGLGELVSALATLRRGGGELMLIAPTARVQRILSVTRLDRVLHVCESELNAILRLRAQRVPGCGPVGGVDCKTGGRLRTIVSANDSRLHGVELIGDRSPAVAVSETATSRLRRVNDGRADRSGASGDLLYCRPSDISSS